MSTSGIFGRQIQLQPELTIFYRCLLGAIILFTFIKIKKKDFLSIEKTHFKYIILAGLLMALHWVTYFYSLSIHSIAIAILTLHTFPAMTAILEPLILKSPFRLYHIALALLVVLGIWIILPSIDMEDALVSATFFGIVSALAYALRNIFTKKIMSNYDGSTMMWYQLMLCGIILSPYLFVYKSVPIASDWIYIIALVVFTTVLGHTLFVSSLKHFSAITVSLISCIIPIYGILWGIIFINEIPTPKTIIGGSLILVSFFIESYYSKKQALNKVK